MKILQIVPGVDEHAGGPSVSVPALCRQLQKHADTELIMLNDVPSFLGDIQCKSFPVKPFPTRLLGRSPLMSQYICEQAKKVDIISTHSLWMMPNIYQGPACRKGRAKSVVVPRGTLSKIALSYSPLKKRIIWYLGQRKTLKGADLFIATCEEEYQDIRALGFRQPVAIIPNGISLPETIPNSNCKKKTLLFLSRIHKKKGVDLLLSTWHAIMDQFPDWSLVIAGGTQSEYAQNMIQLKEELGCQRVSFSGELLGDAKEKAFSEASCFVLPTHSENFGIAVAEALAHCVPVITTTGAPWKELIEKEAGWWIPLDELEETMRKALSQTPEELLAMGMRGRKWMEEDFSWEKIGQNTIQAYEWLLDPNKNNKPEFVQIG